MTIVMRFIYLKVSIYKKTLYTPLCRTQMVQLCN